jgi:hypothetical protein
MSDPQAGARVPDPERARLIRSCFVPSPIEVVAEAIAAAWDAAPALYVERLGDKYRWSLAHTGGAYPLLRLTARFLRIDYQALLIGFRTVEDGYSILTMDPEEESGPDAATTLKLASPVDPDEAARLIEGHLR